MRRSRQFFISYLLVPCFMLGRASAQARPLARVPLEPTTVAQALSAQGFPVDRSEVEMPNGLSTTTDQPQLRASAADLLPDGRLRVRLSCARTGDCQPFFVIVHTATAGDGLRALATLQEPVSGYTKTRAEATQIPEQHILAGSRATLLMEDAHMRIHLPVIAIDSGAPGAEIRVSSLDRKQTFHAVVADAQTVRGVLP